MLGDGRKRCVESRDQGMDGDEVVGCDDVDDDSTRRPQCLDHQWRGQRRVEKVVTVRGLGQNPAWSSFTGSCEFLRAKQSSHNCAVEGRGLKRGCQRRYELLASAIVCSEELDGWWLKARRRDRWISSPVLGS